MGQTPSSLAHSTKANIRTSKVLSTDVDLEMVDDKTSTANPRPAPSSMANGAKASIRKDKSKGHTAKAIAAKGKVSKQGEKGSGQRHTLASAAAGVNEALSMMKSDRRAQWQETRNVVNKEKTEGG